MPDRNPKPLTCPACGAPLNYDGRSVTVKCSFCQNVIVFEGLKPETAKPDTSRKPRAERPTIVPAEVVNLLRSGKKAEAVKRYRELYDVSKARAQYAIEQIEAGNLHDPEAGFPTREAEARPVTVHVRTAPASGSRLGGVIAAFIFIVISGIVGLALLQPGGPFTPRLIAGNPSMTVPGGQDSAPDVVSLFHNLDEESRLLGRISRTDSKLTWKTDALPGDGYVDALASDNERVYAVIETNLLAFNIADGSPLWQVNLPDNLDSGKDNLLIQDGRVIVMTMDRSLQAYEATTGRPVWSRPILSYARDLRIIGGQLAILDYIADGHDLNIFLLDPVDGSEERVIFPECTSENSWEEYLNDDSGIIYDNANGLYLFFGSSFGCIQHYDLASGQLLWETQSEDSFNTSFHGFGYLQTSDSIYFGNDERLSVLDKQSGSLKLLIQDDAYAFAPLAISGDTLLTLARRTKGSERFELWGLDSASGAQTWEWIPENASPIDPPYEMSGLVSKDESGWTWQLTPNGLLLIQFQAEPTQLVLTTYDPDNGAILAEKTVSLKGASGDFYSIPKIIAWRNGEVYFQLEGTIYALDFVNGQIIMEYQ